MHPLCDQSNLRDNGLCLSHPSISFVSFFVEKVINAQSTITDRVFPGGNLALLAASCLLGDKSCHDKNVRLAFFNWAMASIA